MTWSLRWPVRYTHSISLTLRSDEYLAYWRRSAKEVQAHGGHVVALGKFREAAAGDIKPRSVMILVEWMSKAAFDAYCSDPRISGLAPASRERRSRLHLAPCSTSSRTCGRSLSSRLNFFEQKNSFREETLVFCKSRSSTPI